MTNAMNELYDTIGSIFNPANNPYFVPSKHDDNVEDAEIIEEIKL